MPHHIYFDAAAGVPKRKEISDIITKNQGIFANASSIHQAGQQARYQIDKARMTIASICGVDSGEVLFTSGATEALHLAIVGHYLSCHKNLKNTYIYASPLLHSAGNSALKFLETYFDIKVKYLPITEEGIIDLEKISGDLCHDILGSHQIVVEHGNSEIGALQPIAKLGKFLKKKSTELKIPKPTFIIDVAASIISQPVGLKYQVADMVAFSAGKFGGLKGSGCLIKSKMTSIAPVVGGSHEFGLRGGTENFLGIIAQAKALEIHNQNRDKQNHKLDGIFIKISKFFQKNFPEIMITTPNNSHLKHIFHFIHPKISGNLLVQKADLLGIAISSGAACSSGAVKKSRVLKNLKIPKNLQGNGVRISWDQNTTEKELEKLFQFFLKNL